MTWSAKEKSSGTLKFGLRPREVALVRREVRQRLLAQGFADIPLSVLDQAMGWPSVLDVLQGPAGPETLQHAVELICRYLPRRLKQGFPEESRFLPLDRPEGRVLDSRYGVAYALALAAKAQPGTWDTVLACRRQYWGQAEAPFPWLGVSLRPRREEAERDAATWLTEHAADQAQAAPLELVVRFEGVGTGEVIRAARELIELRGGEAKTHPAAVLTALIRQLEDAGATISNFFSAQEYFPDIDLRAAGLSLRLGSVTVTTSRAGSLWPLFRAALTLHRSQGWAMESALRLILTDEPPRPQFFRLQARSGVRMPKALSVEHIALVQLVACLPEASWPQRLRQWDEWLRLYPEEELRQTFQNSRPDRVTADVQRAKWLAKEYRRAYDRAIRFFPLVTWPATE